METERAGKRRGILQQCSNEEKKTKTKTCRGRESERQEKIINKLLPP
jgi:hypothetical protein